MSEKNTPNRDLIAELGLEESVVFENPDYDAAIIGYTDDGRVVYDYEKMAKCLMDEDGMTYEDAVEFIDYNTIRALPYAGPNGPIVIYPINIYTDEN